MPTMMAMAANIVATPLEVLQKVETIALTEDAFVEIQAQSLIRVRNGSIVEGNGYQKYAMSGYLCGSQYFDSGADTLHCSGRT
jgi:hypothetical protein